MTKTAKQILSEFERSRRFDEDPAPRIDQALKEIEAIHQQEIAKARIDELSSLVDRLRKGHTVTRGDFSVDNFDSIQIGEEVEEILERIAELFQTLKEHKEQ